MIGRAYDAAQSSESHTTMVEAWGVEKTFATGGVLVRAEGC